MKRILGILVALFLLVLCGIAGAEDLVAPENVGWVEDSLATATWDTIDGAEYYQLEVSVYYLDNTFVGQCITGTSENSVDIQQEIHQIIGEDKSRWVNVFYCVAAGQVQPGETDYTYGEYSARSVVRTYNPGNTVFLLTPRIELTEEGLLTIYVIENATGYCYGVTTIANEFDPTSGMLYTNPCELASGYIEASEAENGVIQIQLDMDEINRAYSQLEDPYDEKVYVYAYSDEENYLDSETAFYSIQLTRLEEYTKKRLSSPRIELTEEDLLTIYVVENATGYCYGVTTIANEFDPTSGMLYTNPCDLASGYIEASEAENGVIQIQLNMNKINLAYSQLEDPYDEKVYVYAYSDGDNYLDSESAFCSIQLSEIEQIELENLILSPQAPIVYLGGCLILGKTIEPVDAYYTNIVWTSTDDSIVSVSETGKISGITPGTATITATIGDVTASVPVTVYTIATNVEDSTDQQEVTDAAGSIIDDIGNNEEPDLSNTDVDPDDTEDLQEQIHEGIERGDEFRTDILLSKRDWAHLKKYESQIQQWLDNGAFAGGYDINAEVYHQDGAGNKYHIANITQFGNEIGFTIERDALEENAPGQLKDLRMIRIHDGQLEVIPVTVNPDGSISSKSDKFSEFILIYENTAFGQATFTMPAQLTMIEESAFEGNTMMTIVDAHNCSFIGENAFMDTGLTQIRLPKDCRIQESAFDDKTIYVFAPDGGITRTYCDGHDNIVFIAE